MAAGMRANRCKGNSQMTDCYIVNIAIQVTNAIDLRNAAIGNYRTDNPNAHASEIDEAFGPENDINISACLIELFDPGDSPEGTTILESSVS
ncbi:MAG: hypothetical protein CL949_10105 [Erythrobacter sp.]|nr:hypothetical protein [Erythrobacter sp.]|tara:strand:+ start:125 stop:400 length:276 start_codon:yes stop_codon:yes gene_type:complete